MQSWLLACHLWVAGDHHHDSRAGKDWGFTALSGGRRISGVHCPELLGIRPCSAHAPAMTQSVRLRLIYWSLFVGMLLTVATTCGWCSIADSGSLTEVEHMWSVVGMSGL